MDRYLVLHDYGDGKLWAFVNADSKDEIETKFHSVVIYTKTPEWLTPEMELVIPTYFADNPGGWLKLVERE